MTDSKTRRRLIEWGKSLLILLLTLSALYLLGRIQLQANLSADVAGNGIFGALIQFFLPGDDLPGEVPTPEITPGAVRPVRLAVYQEGQRYGIQYDTAGVDAAFAELSTLLSEGLSSAKAPRQVSEDQWQAALGREGLYFDFLFPMPMTSLSAWLEAGTGNDTLSGCARRMCLAGDTDGGGVSLFYHNEDDGLYYACQTTLSREIHLDAAVANWLPNGAIFAFESEQMQTFNPYTMLTTTPSPPVFSAENPLVSDVTRLDALLSTLSFLPQSAALDAVNGGQIVAASDSLRLSSAGALTFHSIGNTDFRFPISGQSRQDILNYVRTLAEATVGAWCGDAQLYLSDVKESNGTLTITFQYSLEGAQVTLPSGQDAARFVVRSGAVTDFSLLLRTYTATEDFTPVLPEVQALAAMQVLEADGMELLLCYQDGGGEQLSAGWIAI